VGALLLGIALQIDALAFTALVPLFWHMLMLGWITQIIMGVSLWMFPRRKKVESFKNQCWAWIAYLFLEIGLILRIITEPLILTSSLVVWEILLALSAILQFMAVVFYTLEIWPRVLSKEKLKRVRKKER
tara:strand:- start:6520 stop:6909 length:390 start_codon:yes stop_codon:yes gene_type:complete